MCTTDNYAHSHVLLMTTSFTKSIAATYPFNPAILPTNEYTPSPHSSISMLLSIGVSSGHVRQICSRWQLGADECAETPHETVGTQASCRWLDWWFVFESIWLMFSICLCLIDFLHLSLIVWLIETSFIDGMPMSAYTLYLEFLFVLLPLKIPCRPTKITV